MTITIPALAFFCCALLGNAGAQVLSNEFLRVEFDPKTGALVDFSDNRSGHGFLERSTKSFLWELKWRNSTTGNSGIINAIAAQSFHFEKIGANGVRLFWETLQLTAAPRLKVEATVSLDPQSALSRWTIALRESGELQFEQVRFPCVQNIAEQKNEFLVAPVWIGQLAEDPRKMLNESGKSHEWRYEYPGHASMQCFGFYQKSGPGLYFACDDTNAFHKTFVFAGDGNGGVNFSLVQLPEKDAAKTTDYVQNYQTVLGAFSGDWFTVAKMYRSWGTNQWWAKESRLLRNENNWSHDTALWVWNRGRSDEVIEPALALQKKLRLPVSAMWHWWHGCSYDTGFPEYFPPREGARSFSNALVRAHANDIHSIVYMNQRLWGMTTKSWTEMGVTNYAVLDAGGKIHPEIYNSFTKGPCASMCMGTLFWRNYYAGLTEDAFRLGVDGIYMDQACTSLACYNPNHAHPPGGGTYWMKGFCDMSTDIRQRAKHVQTSAKRAVALAGEGTGESWLPYLDLMLSLQVSRERYSTPDGWEPVPFFQAVYHPYAIQYGNYSSLTMPPYDELWPKEFAPKEPLKLLDRKFSQQFYLEQARAFVWGQQPTIANFKESHLKERPEEIAYVLQLARIRNRTQKFLQYGRFLQPPELNAPEKTIDISRLSIYAGQQGGLTTSMKTVPLAIAGAWKAKDGAIGVAVASISNGTMSLRLKLDRSRYAFPERGTIYRIGEKKREKLGRFSGDIDLPLSLSPREACVVEIVR